MQHAIELTPQPLPAKGDLSETPFALLLGTARALGSTGVLRVREEKEVFLARGVPVAVRSELADETSEIYMIREGVIGPADLDVVRGLATKKHTRFSEALLALGHLEPSQVFEHTKRRAVQNLTSCFGWVHGPVEFTELERLGGDVVPLSLDLVEVLVTGVGRFYDMRRLDRELPIEDGHRVYLKPLPSTPTAGAALGTIDARICQLAAGRPTVQSLATAVRLPERTVRQRLFVLYCLGRIGFLPPGAPVPGTRPPSRVETLRSFAPPSAQVVAERIASAGAVAERIASATGNPVRRIATRPQFSMPRPEDAPTITVHDLVEDAEAARRAGQHHVAIRTLRYALTKAPEDPLVLGELALSLLVSDKKLHAREANNLAREARRHNPDLAAPYVVMGMLMELVGEPARAQQLFRHALQRDPQCEEARKALAKLRGKD